MRRLSFAIALIGAWVHHARATVVMTPNPVDVGGVVIGNTGSTIGTLSSTGGNNNKVWFVVTSCAGGGGMFSISPDTVYLDLAQQITVSYTATARGTQTCTVDVRDRYSNSVGSFTVRATGQLPPMISVAPTASFGAVRWNNAAAIHVASQTITVTNLGDATLNINGPVLGGLNANEFAITAGGAPAGIPGGSSRSWTVAFDPASTGDKAATLRFYSNDPARPFTGVDLSGTGTNAMIGVSDVAFGIVATGFSSALDITVSNVAMTPKGNLGVTSAAISGGSWFTFSGCGGGTSCTLLPALSIATSAVIGVVCKPPAGTMAGAQQTASVTVASDTDDPLDRVAYLSCTAGTSSLTTSSSTLTFSPQLVTTASAAQSLTVTNTGNVQASFYFQRTGVGATSFSVTTVSGCGASATTPCLIGPSGGSQSFSITFSPDSEGDISAGLDLRMSTTPFPQLALAGHGIDRHVAVDGPVTFPDTFRTTPSAMPIAIRNIGEYPLHVEAIVVGSDPIWSLVDVPGPFDVPALDSHDVIVQFTPEAAGKAPEGTLVVTSDDRNAPMLVVPLFGNGKNRNVQILPGAIDLGQRAVGVPTRLSAITGERLSIVNLDDSAFRIREVGITGDRVFRVETIDGDNVADLELLPTATDQLDVVFTPAVEGDFTATLDVYLDQDPAPQLAIPIHATAVRVDVHGGGGCMAAPKAGNAGVIAAIVMLVRRRRRARSNAR